MRAAIQPRSVSVKAVPHPMISLLAPMPQTLGISQTSTARNGRETTSLTTKAISEKRDVLRATRPAPGRMDTLNALLLLSFFRWLTASQLFSKKTCKETGHILTQEDEESQNFAFSLT